MIGKWSPMPSSGQHHVLGPDRQAANAASRGVEDSVGDRNTYHAELAHAFDPQRVDDAD